ncbi:MULTISPECIES: hypothetical protein [Arsenophonus]|uniref:hypothetical protein n=1 Tax=Arsenophonus TaxID=637 RepID=UPI00387A461D
MNVFSILSNPKLPLDLTDDQYNRATHREYPYVRTGDDGKPRHYALCPECNNAVQLVNRSLSSTESLTLYAKHINFSLSDLAEYDQDEYEECQLANPHRFDGMIRRKSGKKSNRIREFFSKHIDLIINFAETITGIKFSDKTIECMISEFCKSRGYEYRAVSEFNLPIAFVYMTEAKNLYGSSVNSQIADAINNKSEGFEVNKSTYKHSFISKKKGYYESELKIFFSNHSIPSNDKMANESVMMYISEIKKGQLPENAPIIFDKKITLDKRFFYHTINRRERFQGMVKSNIE